MDGDSKTLQEYSQLVKAYANMRHQISDLLWVMEEEEAPTQTEAQRTAGELLDMAYEYMDEVNERLVDVDRLMMSVQSLIFSYQRLMGKGTSGSESNLEDLQSILASLDPDSRGVTRFDH